MLTVTAKDRLCWNRKLKAEKGKMYNEMQAGEDGFDVHIGVLSLWLLITWYKYLLLPVGESVNDSVWYALQLRADSYLTTRPLVLGEMVITDQW
jgi:hypothetical protein